ncbi:DNA-binding protein [Burkholderia sp. Nafp2/4-1b]|uniref:DNA-binding protein n=1 Tax=Burkholderia sp. Nafp2/4-1b TaxID=2116686 RepID=UPI000EF8EF35|nr:DNA-binding protein [Burkholderia sp. Nafp2/4-1b]RKU01808.1 DNA-binding protein [Burkholderia sp. Nafp2/4-1b]
MRTPALIEPALRQALHGPRRHDVQIALGWDDSQISRFLSGTQGVVIDKIDKLVAAIGFVLVTRKYLDAVATLGEVGVHCECARRGYGECRPDRRYSCES